MSEGEFVAILGPNGAGKTTTLRTIAGLLKPTRGEIAFKGKQISHLPTHEIIFMGVSYVSEDLNLFTNMSVYENLLLGAYLIKEEAQQQETMEFIFALFPRLAERRKQLAGTLSGGERKMLAIARGLMSRPELILIDEPSLGLAPVLVEDVFTALLKLHEQGLTILLVEQNVNATLEITDRAYVLEHGQIAMEGKSADLLKDDHIQNVYLGL
ncbi:ATP-binding cassette domain-containing protein [candidate division KSB3 bacterium]|uniref:ATP-binding cassette domain-containing protein n=1 Tax=candidate division KSB3 bacterium TaxID=2044937 RepID=A0A9D5Q4V8_9BACT|nr:ATP-binding cassette domain-containing protein [candidate division KSB3 bacterium]MBD3323955.1 ATP-binding cassette domain-containing protein [candidate division KSB3 bacterium]